MFKPCPKCGFLVALIAGREASQRCPRCGSALVTDGELHEVDAAAPAERREVPSQVATVAPSGAAVVEGIVTAVPQSDSEVALDVEPDAPTAEAATLVRPSTQPTNGQPTAPLHDGPSFVRRRAPRRSLALRWPWLAAIAALALLLAMQLLLAQRSALARDAAWRPLVLNTCGVLGCDVPAWHEPQAYAMLARSVRPDAANPGVLHVTATVRNDARWPQPPPVVVLSLSDVDGRVVGARAVAPADYGRREATPVAPGDSVDIAFDVREPPARVESFDFQLQ